MRSVVSTSTITYTKSFDTFVPLCADGVKNDGGWNLASGIEALVGVLRSVTQKSAAIAADLFVAEALGVRSRVLVFGLLGLDFIFM